MKITSGFLGRCLGIVLLLVCVTACAGAPKDSGVSTSNRVSILSASDKKLVVDDKAHGFDIELAQPLLNKAWAQAGRNAEHEVSHVTMVQEIDEAWRAKIGAGSSGDFRLLAQPVIANDKIFTVDAKGVVSAFDKEGANLWQFDTTPEDAENASIGGGLGVEGYILYVTTGFGEVVALKVADSSVLWRKNVGKPLRAAPTIANQKIYVLTIDNELHALNQRSGDEVWHHSGITENATLMGASSPAVMGDHVVVAYNSGEIYDLRAQNGRVAWSDALTASAQMSALPAIADIRGLPVLDHGLVFAVSHSGRMAAIDLRSGERAWEVDAGGVNTPAVSGNAVFVVTNESSLIALERTTGQIIWIKELQRLKDPDNRDSDRVHWAGPVLAGNRLWLTNSLGSVISYAPTDGGLESDFDVEEPIFIAPIVVDNTIYVLTDKGHLIALR